MTSARWGTHLYWDNRDHTASDRTTDDPQNPGVDIGEWVSPIRTQRSGAPYQARFHASQSYPGFFNDDQNAISPGRQPTLGNGSPDDGTPWGTWGGYFDWDLDTIFDTPTGWACTVFLVGQSSVSVDNFPGTTSTTSVTIRKPRQFRPAAGTSIAWALRDDRTEAVLQSGTTTAEAEGLIAITGLTIPKDPQRVRLEVRTASSARPGDLNADGFIDIDDLYAIHATLVDLDGDGVASWSDKDLLERFIRRYELEDMTAGRR
jgi:hypothetical protein